MLPYYDYTAAKCTQTLWLREVQPQSLSKPKLRYRLCSQLGTWLIALGKRLTAVAPNTPSATYLELV
jgi:hypothetical protein